MYLLGRFWSLRITTVLYSAHVWAIILFLSKYYGELGTLYDAYVHSGVHTPLFFAFHSGALGPWDDASELPFSLLGPCVQWYCNDTLSILMWVCLQLLCRQSAMPLAQRPRRVNLSTWYSTLVCCASSFRPREQARHRWRLDDDGLRETA